MNKVILLGRLGRDPEIRYTSGEPAIAVTRFSIAVDRKRRHDEEKQTDWFSCVAFGKTAEDIGKYFVKGSRIALSGRLQTGSYEKEGQTVKTMDVVVEDFDFCDSKAAVVPASSDDTAYTEEDVDDDDLPF